MIFKHGRAKLDVILVPGAIVRGRGLVEADAAHDGEADGQEPGGKKWAQNGHELEARVGFPSRNATGFCPGKGFGALAAAWLGPGARTEADEVQFETEAVGVGLASVAEVLSVGGFRAEANEDENETKSFPKSFSHFLPFIIPTFDCRHVEAESSYRGISQLLETLS